MRNPSVRISNYWILCADNVLFLTTKSKKTRMNTNLSEDEVHEYIYTTGLEKLVVDCHAVDSEVSLNTKYVEEFHLWRLIKQKALSKISALHRTVRYGEFIASKLKLPTNNTNHMELDLIGTHEKGLFILELKVNRSAERNAFSELFAYSCYVAEIFAASGRHDITNVLVANLDAKITRHAFLYDLLIADRDVVVYKPTITDDKLDSLQLQLHLPSDEDFIVFTNNLLSHDSMSCVVASFDDLDGWFDSDEENGSLNNWTVEHLSKLSNYTAQLMEAEGLHGFCFIRKPWKEIPCYYRNSLVICAINPFKSVNHERAKVITNQLSYGNMSRLFELPELGFDGRIIRIGQRAISECLTHNHSCEVELPLWAAFVNSTGGVVATHNFAFNPTGIFREAYVSSLHNTYELNKTNPECAEDVSILKVNEITNWLRAWEFMEMCGFKDVEQ